ncbi:MAG TPA: efflux transporter outer membrane subunit [Sphingomicrobium sp.]|nr:efflux transporter outer membrane subunit [Sphingomicrobium sp.]
MKRAVTLLALVATSCATMEPHYVRPDAAIPASWPTGDAYLRQSEANLPAVTYREIFRDARLQALIGQALANNRDLMIAAANIAAAREQYRIQRAQQFPQLDANAGVTVSGDRDNTVSANYQTGIGVPSFELDLFGRLRSLSHAQLERYFATEAAARSIRLTLVADIADAWLNHAADSSLLLIARQTAANAEKSVRLTRARLEGGIAPRTDLRQAEQVLTAAQADLARQRTAVAQDVNLLQLLVGAPIDATLLPGSIDDAAPTISELPAGLDSYVLLRRPDVVQAEYQLRAANAEIGAARAALFPRISLTGLLGFASSALTKLFTGGAFGWQASADASYTIFNAGAGRANVRLSEAQKAAALASYQKAIQTAFREVSDALARRGTIADELSARQRQQAAAADVYLLTEARYQNGIDSFLNSLDAQRSYYSAQQTLVLAKLTAAQNRVDLYQSLGGDSLLGPPAG